jgi:hypothetical protein
VIVVLGVVCVLLFVFYLLGCATITTTAWQFERERDLARSDLRLANQRIRELEAQVDRDEATISALEVRV